MCTLCLTAVTRTTVQARQVAPVDLAVVAVKAAAVAAIISSSRSRTATNFFISIRSVFPTISLSKGQPDI
jgi:ketopantoate reductase